jgi:hypothetical protein
MNIDSAPGKSEAEIAIADRQPSYPLAIKRIFNFTSSIDTATPPGDLVADDRGG